jgi:dUTP pyrophosphatase
MINEKLDYVPEIKFKKTHELAKLPTKNNPTDTGYDLYAVQEMTIPARGSAVVPVGLQVAYIPAGYWFRIESRSGLSFKHHILAHPGVIDQDYRGDLGTKLYNHSDVDYVVKVGDRIAQMAIYYNISMPLSFGEPTQTERGNKGHGSSGK